MERALLDTDILSEVLKGKNPAVVGHAVEYAEAFGRFTYTAVRVHEILYGLHYKEAYRQIAQAQVSFAESDVIVPALEDYETAGRIRGVARSQGRQLALDDCLIAAVAARLAVPSSPETPATSPLCSRLA